MSAVIPLDTGRMPVVEPKFRRLRAMKMIEGKAMRNMTNKALAIEFNCSTDTVERTLTWAKRADIFASFEDKIVQELIPLAHAAIRDALADGNAKIAVEVFKGLNLLKTGQGAPQSAQRAHDDDLAAYISAKRDHAQLRENTIDVTPGRIDATTTTTGLEESHPDPAARTGDTEAPTPTSQPHRVVSLLEATEGLPPTRSA